MRESLRFGGRVGIVGVAVAVGAMALAGCTNPMGSSAPGGSGGGGGSGSSSIQTLWNDGQFGTWFGVTESAPVHELMAAPANVVDSVTGATTTFLLTSNGDVTPSDGYREFMIVTVPGPQQAASVLSGHLVFDAMLASPMAGATMTVGYGASIGTVCADTSVSLATLNTTTFTQVSIPGSAFISVGGGCSGGMVQTAFDVRFTGVGANTPTVYLGDIQWTSY